MEARHKPLYITRRGKQFGIFACILVILIALALWLSFHFSSTALIGLIILVPVLGFSVIAILHAAIDRVELYDTYFVEHRFLSQVVRVEYANIRTCDYQPNRWTRSGKIASYSHFITTVEPRVFSIDGNPRNRKMGKLLSEWLSEQLTLQSTAYVQTKACAPILLNLCRESWFSQPRTALETREKIAKLGHLFDLHVVLHCLHDLCTANPILMPFVAHTLSDGTVAHDAFLQRKNNVA